MRERRLAWESRVSSRLMRFLLWGCAGSAVLAMIGLAMLKQIGLSGCVLAQGPGMNVMSPPPLHGEPHGGRFPLPEPV